MVIPVIKAQTRSKIIPINTDPPWGKYIDY